MKIILSFFFYLTTFFHLSASAQESLTNYHQCSLSQTSIVWQSPFHYIEDSLIMKEFLKKAIDNHYLGYCDKIDFQESTGKIQASLENTNSIEQLKCYIDLSGLLQSINNTYNAQGVTIDYYTPLAKTIKERCSHVQDDNIISLLQLVIYQEEQRQYNYGY